MKEISKRQMELLKIIANLGQKLMRPASLKEIADQIGISRQNARVQLWKLKDKGYVNFSAQARQAIVPIVTDKAKLLLGNNGFAVLGSIAAGEPIYASSSLEKFTNKLSDILPLNEGDYLLKVAGDSMINVGYFDKDYVIVRPQQTALNGEIIVAFLPAEESATLKRYYLKDDCVLLVAENKAYKDIKLAKSELLIQGIVVGHISNKRPSKTSA